MISILLDTSYLITLADPGRAHHETAKRYLREALAQGFPLYLSAVVASEFQVGQPIRDGLHNSLRSVIARPRAVRCVAFLANSPAIGKKSNAADRATPRYHRPQGVMQAIPNRLSHLKL